MEQLLLSLSFNVLKCLFSNTILEMGIHLPIGDLLFVLLTISYENTVNKTAIVTMVMLKIHTITFCKTFGDFLCHDSFLWGNVFMRCMYSSLDKWSTNMVAIQNLLLVSHLLSWALNQPMCWSFDQCTHSNQVLLPWKYVFYHFRIALSFTCSLSWPQADIQHMLVAWLWRDAW